MRLELTILIAQSVMVGWLLFKAQIGFDSPILYVIMVANAIMLTLLRQHAYEHAVKEVCDFLDMENDLD